MASHDDTTPEAVGPNRKYALHLANDIEETTSDFLDRRNNDLLQSLTEAYHERLFYAHSTRLVDDNQRIRGSYPYLSVRRRAT